MVLRWLLRINCAFSKFTYLDGELTGWAKNDGLNAAGAEQVLFTEVLRGWQAEGQCLATTSQITGDDILTIVDGVEGVLLDGEEVLDATLDHLLGRGGLDLGEACELTVRDIVVLQSSGLGLLASQTSLVALAGISASVLVLFWNKCCSASGFKGGCCGTY